MDSLSTIEIDGRRESTTSSPDHETTELTAPLVAASSERCPNCGAGMAPDQRYCIQCGERRTGGGLRDALPRTQATPAATVPPRRARLSANSSLIAGIATLLIAMGVGVLIGRTGDHSSKSAGNAPVQILRVPASGAAGTAVTGGTTTGTSTKSASKKSKTAHSRGPSKTPAATKAKLPPPVVKVGSKCATGSKGCSKGKFTGSFFGQ
jgi:hypothetical protein